MLSTVEVAVLISITLWATVSITATLLVPLIATYARSATGLTATAVGEPATLIVASNAPVLVSTTDTDLSSLLATKAFVPLTATPDGS